MSGFIGPFGVAGSVGVTGVTGVTGPMGSIGPMGFTGVPYSFDDKLRDSEVVQDLLDKVSKLDHITDVMEELLGMVKKLDERMTKIEYAPGGVGYEETKEHFKSLQ